MLFAAPPKDDPVAFGRSELYAALAAKGLTNRIHQLTITTTGHGDPEGFGITFHRGNARIVGADPNGAMYGALELAERIRREGRRAWGGPPITRKPFLHQRGWNEFLTLPYNIEKHDSDYDPAALIDPKRWWFQNDDFWHTLFDQMARARLNWLDLHGAWDISSTGAPNLYAYFIQSKKYPLVGVSTKIKAANLRRLNRVIAMAHARGVHVSLMAYEARFRIPQNPNPPYQGTEAQIYDYTREVVEKMIRQAPKLDAIGFRIGESGHGENFFKCYQEAIRRSGRNIPLLTRSWLTTKPKVVALARASSDFTVEIKYNGEQWGPPYFVAGGRMAGWYSYSFEDYLSDSGPGKAKRIWPGARTADGRWPSQPYKIVWQVRANGTHRIFPFYNPEWVRRTIQQMPLGTADGFSVEPMDCYFPKMPRYYLANAADQYCNWVHQRDVMYLTLWGRLGYDPTTPEAAFDAMIGDRLGAKAGKQLADAWQAASRIVPLVFTAWSLGPDHRNHAPELEWGGNADAYIQNEAFDTHLFQSIDEALANRATGGKDGRLTTEQILPELAALARKAERVSSISLRAVRPADRKWFREIAVACRQLARLSDYYQGRFLAARRTAESEAAGADPELSVQAAAAMSSATFAWAQLSQSSDAAFYRPFTDRLRMHTNTYHWLNTLPEVEAEGARLGRNALPDLEAKGAYLDRAAANMRLAVHAPRSKAAKTPISLPQLTVKTVGAEVVCSLPAGGVTAAWTLYKPLPSTTYFHKAAMVRRGDRFEFRFRRENWGHAVSAEVEAGGAVRGLPDWRRATPYLIVPARPGATPRIYSGAEALTYLDPNVLKPEKQGLILIGPRAWNFHHAFSIPMQRKLLEPVSRGMTLLVLQQDYASGRYPLDWLPKQPRVEACRERVFDPAGALGLSKIEADRIMTQRFLPTEGWKVFGNGGVAEYPYGKGEIWIVNARLTQQMHRPDCAKALVRLLRLNLSAKPVVLVDAGSESAFYTSSAVTDLMNAQSISYLTLGEVIAREQGMNSAQPMAAKMDDDMVLGGKGAALLHDFLEAKVKAKAARPLPTTREALEKDRPAQRHELLRCLGLDPLPKRTPLNVRITRVVRRPGYRIENLVYDSRPNFPVTAQLYIPDGMEGKKLPVIVNVIGHWQHKKAEPVVQSRVIFQALHGYLALIIDSPGFSFEGDAHIERRWAGTHHDLKLITGATNATSVYVWDAMRALDYLETRPEADMKHVGLTGASGGGLATLYAFAAEPRFTCAVPVVYASSLEINPDNGCECNHVPGTLQIGDRSDVLAIRAPAPVFIIGAQQDVEFPAAGMQLTGEKLKKIWGLFGAQDDAGWQVFPGGHDYNQAMQERMIGFFDQHLRGLGDGSPVPRPALQTVGVDDPEMFCLPEPPTATETMRGIAQDLLSHAKPVDFAEVTRLNGGLPPRVPLNYHEIEPSGAKRHITFDAEQGLTIPGVLWLPTGAPKAAVVLISEKGKVAAEEEFRIASLVEQGCACLAVDVRGFGELSDLDPRLMAYLGTGAPFAMGWDAARAAEAMLRYAPKVAVVGSGAGGAQAALFAALLEPRIGFVAGLNGLKEYADVFRDEVPLYAVQPRAVYGAPLSHLRRLAPQTAVWSFAGDPAAPDWNGALYQWAGQ